MAEVSRVPLVVGFATLAALWSGGPPWLGPPVYLVCGGGRRLFSHLGICPPYRMELDAAGAILGRGPADPDEPGEKHRTPGRARAPDRGRHGGRRLGAARQGYTGSGRAGRDRG